MPPKKSKEKSAPPQSQTETRRLTTNVHKVLSSILGKEVDFTEYPVNVTYVLYPDISMMYLLGRPGFAVPRIGLIVGPEGSGKSAFLQNLIGIFQAAGGFSVSADTETSYPEQIVRDYVKDVALWKDGHKNILRLNEALGYIGKRIHDINQKEELSGIPFLSILDSIKGGTIDGNESEESISDYFIGQRARLMQNGLDMLRGKILTGNSCLQFFANHGKMKIGTDTGFSEGKKQEIDMVTHPGGKEIDFQAHYWIYIKRVSNKPDLDPEAKGFRVRVKMKKNKLETPHRQADFDVIFGRGISHVFTSMSLLCNSGLVDKIPKRGYTCAELGMDKPLPMEEAYEYLHRPENLVRIMLAMGIGINKGDRIIGPPEFDRVIAENMDRFVECSKDFGQIPGFEAIPEPFSPGEEDLDEEPEAAPSDTEGDEAPSPAPRRQAAEKPPAQKRRVPVDE